MSQPTPPPPELTRLWLGTFIVSMPESLNLTGVRVRGYFDGYVEHVYADGEVTALVETVHEVRSGDDLLAKMLTLVGSEVRDGVPPEAVPTRVSVEVAYEDVSADQQTPSLLDSVSYPCRQLAEKAMEAVCAFASDREDGWQVQTWLGISPVSDLSTNPQDAVDLAKALLDGDEESEEDDG